MAPSFLSWRIGVNTAMKREFSFKNIQKFLSKIKTKKEKIILWQNILGERKRVNARISNFDKSFEHVT